MSIFWGAKGIPAKRVHCSTENVWSSLIRLVTVCQNGLSGCLSTVTLTLLHSEWPKLHRDLAILSAKELTFNSGVHDVT